MSFSPPPEASKTQINKAMQMLIANTGSIIELEKARSIVEQWRACHAYPINTFQSTLRTKLKDFHNNSFVAQRLKRMPTIIDKLKRFPAMNVTTMQDIGWVRAVVDSMDDVYKLASLYREQSRFKHELVKEKNHIGDPRDEDGYRSLHLVYKYKNERALWYSGLQIELQIRTKLQHTWATAVETMGTILWQSLKSRQWSTEWLDFFALISSALAHEENTTLVPRFSHLSREETYLAIAQKEKKLWAITKMIWFSTAVHSLAQGYKTWSGSSYHIIILNSADKTIEIRWYNRESFVKAEEDYSRIETEKWSTADVVLVSAGPINTLRKAYPNFFLDTSDFTEHLRNIISSVK